MSERQGPFWVHGAGMLRLEVGAPERTPAALWIDGAPVAREVVDGRATLEGELVGDGWHAVVLEVPELLETTPPQGLELESLVVAR
jgi:hypothetical protein